jgi:hypothetical protein
MELEKERMNVSRISSCTNLRYDWIEKLYHSSQYRVSEVFGSGAHQILLGLSTQ